MAGADDGDAHKDLRREVTVLRGLLDLAAERLDVVEARLVELESGRESGEARQTRSEARLDELERGDGEVGERERHERE